jgi:hypothetical protein
VHWAKSDLRLDLYSHKEKRPPNFSPNSPLELLFAKNTRANRSKKRAKLVEIVSRESGLKAKKLKIEFLLAI